MGWQINPYAQPAPRVVGRKRQRRAPMRGRSRGEVLPPMAPGAPQREMLVEDIMWEVVERLQATWGDQIAAISFEVRTMPYRSTLERAEARGEAPPLGVALASKRGGRQRVVLFRRPLETAAAGEPSLVPWLVADVAIELVAEFLGIPPEDVDPLYGNDDE